MKYVVRLKLKKNELKLDYRRIFISFFKKSITEYMDGYFYDELYNSGARQKKIVWAIRMKKPKFDKKKIELECNNIDLIFKSYDVQTALIYYSSLLAMKDVEFNIGDDNQMVLKSIRMVRDPDIIDDFAVFKIISPICLRQHDRNTNTDRYVSIGDEDFGLEFNKKLKEDLEYFDEPINELLYNFGNLKKVVIPVYGLMISATIGTFAVSGSPELLNSIKNRGIGSKRNSGFGLVDAINT